MIFSLDLCKQMKFCILFDKDGGRKGEHFSFEMKKLSNNSSWDFEHVLDTMDNYWVGLDKNFCS